MHVLDCQSFNQLEDYYSNLRIRPSSTESRKRWKKLWNFLWMVLFCIYLYIYLINCLLFLVCIFTYLFVCNKYFWSIYLFRAFKINNFLVQLSISQLNFSLERQYSLKGMVHPKMKILWLITHLHVVYNFKMHSCEYLNGKIL